MRRSWPPLGDTERVRRREEWHERAAERQHAAHGRGRPRHLGHGRQIDGLFDRTQLRRKQLSADAEHQEFPHHAACARARSTFTTEATSPSGTIRSAPASRSAAFGIP